MNRPADHSPIHPFNLIEHGLREQQVSGDYHRYMTKLDAQFREGDKVADRAADIRSKMDAGDIAGVLLKDFEDDACEILVIAIARLMAMPREQMMPSDLLCWRIVEKAAMAEAERLAI